MGRSYKASYVRKPGSTRASRRAYRHSINNLFGSSKSNTRKRMRRARKNLGGMY